MDETTKTKTEDGQGNCSEKPNYWAVLPAAVRYDPKLQAGAKLLYAEISSLTDTRGYCWASNAYFERLYGISEPTVRRYISNLRDRGYITVIDGDGGSGRRKIFAGVNPIKNDGVTRSNLTGYPIKNDGVHNNRKENRKENDPPKAPQGAGREKRTRIADRHKEACDYEPELFERFWSMYPRGEKKSWARWEWDQLRADRRLMKKMGAVLRLQLSSEEWRRGVGIPYAGQWLKDRRWEDEIKTARQPQTAEEEVEWIN